MGRKLESLIFFSGLMIGGFGNYFFNSYYNNISSKHELKIEDRLIGILKLKINDIPYLPIGRVEAFDGQGKFYEVFYNSIEGTAIIKESSVIASNDKSIDF